MRRSLGCLLGVEAWKQPCHGLPSTDSAQCPSTRPAPSLSSLLSAETEGDHAWLPRDSRQEWNARGLRDRPKHSGWKEDISTFISPFTLWGDARAAGQSCPSFCSTHHCCWVCIKVIWCCYLVKYMQGFNDRIIWWRSGDVGTLTVFTQNVGINFTYIDTHLFSWHVCICTFVKVLVIICSPSCFFKVYNFCGTQRIWRTCWWLLSMQLQ